MIPRLQLAKNRLLPAPMWPASENKYTPLFIGRSPLRKIAVLADWNVLEPLERESRGRGRLLADLLSNRHVECFRFADEGPPAHLERSHLGGKEYVPGWAILSGPLSVGPNPWGIREVRCAHGKKRTCLGIFNNRHLVAADDRESQAYSELDAAGAAARRKADALAAMVAETLGADLFITNREYVHEGRRASADGVTFCRSDDALAIMGLYLRSQGEFLLSEWSNGCLRTNRGAFYQVGAVDRLPALWRWSAAFAQHHQGGGDETLSYLSGSLLERVSRALQDRDIVHASLNKPQNNDTADEALAALDGVLLWLMGALDASARVVHRVLRVSGKENWAGWQRGDWVGRVAKLDAGLAAIVAKGTGCESVLTILCLLRNSVHGEALQPLGIVTRAKRDGTLMRLPSDDQGKLRGAFANLGGEAAWGVELQSLGQTYVDPGVLLDNLLPRVLQLLNEIMDATRVESLAGVSLKTSDKLPPASKVGLFTAAHCESIRWQLGFSALERRRPAPAELPGPLGRSPRDIPVRS